MNSQHSRDFAGVAGLFGVLAVAVVAWSVTSTRTRAMQAAAPPEADSSLAAPPAAVDSSAPQLSKPSANAPQAAASKAKPAKQRVAKLKGIAWQTSFAAATKLAKKGGKPIMVDFYTDWCGFCKKLDAEVYPDKRVIAAAAGFVPVKINAEHQRALAQKYNVTGYPTIVFLQPDGTLVDTIVGYAPAPEFAKAVQAARSKFVSSARQAHGAARVKHARVA